MDSLLTSPMFGILISLIAFEIGLLIQRKTKMIFLNPLLIAIVIVIVILILGNIPLEHYQVGGNIINMFLGPATVALALPLYQQLQSLKNYFMPIMVGIIVGVIVGLTSTIVCGYICGFNEQLIASCAPKSITTPIGIVVSEQLGGIPSITVLTILVTGVFGAVVAELVFKIFHIDHPIAKGISLGTSAHAIGTTKALSLGSIEGAMSSLAIAVSGLLTVFLAPYVWQLFLSII